MADLASFSLSDRRAAPHSRAHPYRLTTVSAVIQSAARLERGRTLNNVRGREGRGGEGRGGEGRGGEGTVHTFHKPEPLWPRSLAGHPRSGWPASSYNVQRSYSVMIQYEHIRISVHHKLVKCPHTDTHYCYTLYAGCALLLFHVQWKNGHRTGRVIQENALNHNMITHIDHSIRCM